MSLISILGIPCHSSASQVVSVVPVPENNNGRNIKIANVNAKGGIFMNEILECPLADINVKATRVSRCPFHQHRNRGEFFQMHQEIPLHTVDAPRLCDVDTEPTVESADLLRNIGGGDRIREICTRFYARAFVDMKLKEFFFNFDGATSHAFRLANWIIEHMGGEGKPWFESGRWMSREASHTEAWGNERREPELRGVPFKLIDCRVWIRLHFWAVRECGLAGHESFMRWYVTFLSYFVQIYEITAKEYVQQDSQWSGDKNNTKNYLSNGYRMVDLMGAK